MNRIKLIDDLTEKMIHFDQGDVDRIQHFIKVHWFAQFLCSREQVDMKTKFITECAALVHDIGILPAERKYGKSTGVLQEKEGPYYAKAMLKELGLQNEEIERICYLVAHHHTYDQIQGMDYQILVEADFLVNFHEDHMEKQAIEKVLKNIFRTKTGIFLYHLIYGQKQ